MEPLVIALLAGLTPAGHELCFFDERIERVPTETSFDLAAITVETYAARRAYELSAAFRQSGTPVVLGGFHPTLCPEEAAMHAEVIVIGSKIQGVSSLKDSLRDDQVIIDLVRAFPENRGLKGPYQGISW